MKFTRISLLTTFIPSLVMIIFAVVSFSNLLDSLDAMGFFIIGLLLVFPLLFLAQGAACAFGKGNIFISLSVSTLTFVVIVLTLLNYTAFMYIILYYFIAVFAYGITLFSQRIQNKSAK